MGASSGGVRPQADKRARPLSRLAFRIARPARVFMRARNPCLRLRRRLFGWYVRLVTGSHPIPVGARLLRSGNQHREILGALRRPQDYSRGAIYPRRRGGRERALRDVPKRLDGRPADIATMPPGPKPPGTSGGRDCGTSPVLPELLRAGHRGCSHLWIRLLTGAKPQLRPTFSSLLRASAWSLHIPGSRIGWVSGCGYIRW